MPESLTETLRHVMDDAQLEAQALNQEYVTTEHWVLGMLDHIESEARAALSLAGLDPDELREMLLRELPLADQEPRVSGALPLSPKIKRALNAAVMDARLRGESRVTTRSVMAALLEETGTVLRQAVEDCEADVDLVIHLLKESPAEKEP